MVFAKTITALALLYWYSLISLKLGKPGGVIFQFFGEIFQLLMTFPFIFPQVRTNSVVTRTVRALKREIHIFDFCMAGFPQCSVFVVSSWASQTKQASQFKVGDRIQYTLYTIHYTTITSIILVMSDSLVVHRSKEK